MPGLKMKALGLLMKSARFRRFAFNRMKGRALDFLREENVGEKQEELLAEKFRKMRDTKIGKELGIDKATGIEDLPLTTYAFYEKHFLNPTAEAFMYPLDQYVPSMTSGTTGEPKKYLIPKAFFIDYLSKSGFAIVLLATHDGEKVTLEVGDTFYANTPPAPYVTGLSFEIFQELAPSFEIIKSAPKDLKASYKEKVDYFVKNYQNIDIAYMNVTTLLDEIFPRIGKTFELKGFLTTDKSASAFKEKIKAIIGSYPKVAYGSTGISGGTVPSIQYPGAFIFDWRILYPEFLPEEKAINTTEPKTETDVPLVSQEEVEVGSRYQLVATPFKSDITRYIMPDVFECVGIGDDILNTPFPVFEYHSRADKLIVLHNFTRINEDELLKVLKDSGVDFVDFTARVELHGTKEYLVIYVEPTEAISTKKYESVLHQQLFKPTKTTVTLPTFSSIHR